MAEDRIVRKRGRREFLKMAGAAVGSTLLAACAQPAAPTVAPTTAPKAAEPTKAAAAAGPTTAPAAKAATAAPAPTPTPKATPVVPTGATKIVWWRSLTGATGTALDDLADKFNASQDKYRVQVEFQGAYGELRDKLTAAAAAGGNALPDVVMISDVMMPAFARNGVLEPLDDLMKSANGLDFNDYFGVAQRGIVEGKLYQLPLGVSTPILYYNQDAVKAAGLDGPPKTWDDLFDTYIPKLTVKEGSKTSVYGYAFLANADWWWQQSYVWMNGGQLSDDKYNTYFDSKPVIDFLDRFLKRFQAGEAYLPTAADGAAVGYFGSGKANIMIESTGIIGRLKELGQGKFTAGVAFLPEGPSGRKVPTGGMGNSIVSKRTPEKLEASWAFMKFIQTPENIVTFDQKTGYLPFTKKSSEAMADFLKANPNNKVAVDQMQWSRPQSEIQTVPRAVNIYYDAMLTVLAGKADPKVLMPQVQKQVQAIVVEEGLKKS